MAPGSGTVRARTGASRDRESPVEPGWHGEYIAARTVPGTIGFNIGPNGAIFLRITPRPSASFGHGLTRGVNASG